MFIRNTTRSKSTGDMPTHRRGIKRIFDDNGETSELKKRKIEIPDKVEKDYINMVLSICSYLIWFMLLYISISSVYFPVIKEYLDISYNYSYYNDVRKITH